LIGHKFAERTTFIVTKDARLRHVGGVSPAENVEKTLAIVQVCGRKPVS